MARVDRQILEELQAQRRLMEQILSAKAPAPAPEPTLLPTAGTGMMSEYDCLLICMADDVLGAIDRWNKTASARVKAPRSRKADLTI